MEDDDEQDFGLLDVINKLQGPATVAVAFFLLLPCLYRIENATKTTATQVQLLTKDVSTLKQLVTGKMTLEQWQNLPENLRNHPSLKAQSTQQLD